MTRTVLASLALAIAASLTGCARTVEKPVAATPELATEGQCFLPAQVNGYSNAPDGPDGEERLYVHTGARDRWLMDAGSCPELDFSSGVALDTRFNGTRLCSGETALLLVPHRPGGVPDQCNARVVGKVLRP